MFKCAITYPKCVKLMHMHKIENLEKHKIEHASFKGGRETGYTSSMKINRGTGSEVHMRYIYNNSYRNSCLWREILAANSLTHGTSFFSWQREEERTDHFLSRAEEMTINQLRNLRRAYWNWEVPARWNGGHCLRDSLRKQLLKPVKSTSCSKTRQNR